MAWRSANKRDDAHRHHRISRWQNGDWLEKVTGEQYSKLLLRCYGPGFLIALIARLVTLSKTLGASYLRTLSFLH